MSAGPRRGRAAGVALAVTALGLAVATGACSGRAAEGSRGAETGGPAAASVSVTPAASPDTVQDTADGPQVGEEQVNAVEQALTGADAVAASIEAELQDDGR